jgi:hypothetical protein
MSMLQQGPTTGYRGAKNRKASERSQEQTARCQHAPKTKELSGQEAVAHRAASYRLTLQVGLINVV